MRGGGGEVKRGGMEVSMSGMGREAKKARHSTHTHTHTHTHRRQRRPLPTLLWQRCPFVSLFTARSLSPLRSLTSHTHMHRSFGGLL